MLDVLFKVIILDILLCSNTKLYVPNTYKIPYILSVGELINKSVLILILLVTTLLTYIILLVITFEEKLILSFVILIILLLFKFNFSELLDNSIELSIYLL